MKGNKVFIQNIYSAEAGIIAAFGGDMEATQTVTVFTDGDEKMCRYILVILHSLLCKLFLYKNESDYIDCEVKRIQSKRWISDGQL